MVPHIRRIGVSRRTVLAARGFLILCAFALGVCPQMGYGEGRVLRQANRPVESGHPPAAVHNPAPPRRILPVAAQSPAPPSVDAGDESSSPSMHSEPTSAPPDEGRPVMTLDELTAVALRHNPSLGQAAATVGKARGVRRQVGLYPNPTIGYAGQEMGDNGTAGMQGAFFTQTIVLGDKLGWNRRVADQEVQSLLWQVESQRYRVKNDVRRQFYETLGAHERVRIANELHRIAADGLKNAETLERALRAAKPDVLQARIQLQEVEIIQKNAAYDYTASWERLAALVGLPHVQPVTLQPILFDEQPVRDQQTAWAQIMAMSPQLQQARAQVQQARAQIGRERVQPIPNLQLDVGVMHMNVSDDNAATVLLGLPVPLFNANQGNIQRAAAEYHRATRNAQRLKLSLQAQLADRFRQYRQAHNSAVTYRDEIVPAESQTLDLIQQGYPLQFDFLRLLTARRAYYEARLEYLESVIQLRQAEVAIDGLLLSGGLNNVPDATLDAGMRGAALNGQ